MMTFFSHSVKNVHAASSLLLARQSKEIIQIVAHEKNQKTIQIRERKTKKRSHKRGIEKRVFRISFSHLRFVVFRVCIENVFSHSNALVSNLYCFISFCDCRFFFLAFVMFTFFRINLTMVQIVQFYFFLN